MSRIVPACSPNTPRLGGRPGIAAHRAGAAWASQLRRPQHDARWSAGRARRSAVQAGPSLVAFVARDDWAEIELLLEIDLSPGRPVSHARSRTQHEPSAETLESKG